MTEIPLPVVFLAKSASATEKIDSQPETPSKGLKCNDFQGLPQSKSATKNKQVEHQVTHLGSESGCPHPSTWRSEDHRRPIVENSVRAHT